MVRLISASQVLCYLGSRDAPCPGLRRTCPASLRVFALLGAFTARMKRASILLALALLGGSQGHAGSFCFPSAALFHPRTHIYQVLGRGSFDLDNVFASADAPQRPLTALPPPPSMEVRPFLEHGPPENRVDLMFFSDGCMRFSLAFSSLLFDLMLPR